MCNFQIMKIIKKLKSAKNPHIIEKNPKICVFLVQYKGEKITHIRVVAFFGKKNFFLKKNPDQCDFLTQYKGEKNTYIKVIS